MMMSFNRILQFLPAFSPKKSCETTIFNHLSYFFQLLFFTRLFPHYQHEKYAKKKKIT